MIVNAQSTHDAVVGVETTTYGESTRQRAVIAGCQFSPAIKLGRWFCATHVDESGQCVRAVTRTLRPTQDFDLLHVEQCRNSANAAEVNVIDQEADGWIRCALVLLKLANATHLEIAGTVAVTRPVQVWDRVDQLLEMLHGHALDFFAIEHSDAGRHVGCGALAKICEHNDLVDGVGRPGTGRKDAGKRGEIPQSFDFIHIPFLRRHYPVQVLRVPDKDLRPKATPVDMNYNNCRCPQCGRSVFVGATSVATGRLLKAHVVAAQRNVTRLVENA